MKITSKILLLIIFFLTALAANTFVGLTQLTRMGKELQEVATKDIVLTRINAGIMQYQLEKAIRFERMLAIAEEIAFQDIAPARRTYLIDYLDLTKKEFDELTEQSAKTIIQGKAIVKEEAGNLVRQIEKAHIAYDELVNQIFAMITAGQYELSLEDLKEIQDRERDVTRQLKSLSDEIQMFTQNSLATAQKGEAVAYKTLLTGFVISMLISLMIAISIIHSLSGPLKRLVPAAQKIGKGDFKVDLPTESKDEFGELSRAIEHMAKELAVLTSELKKKSEHLAQSLDITQRQKKDLEKMNLELDSFVHTLSHDVGTPLMGISWYARLLEKDCADKLDTKGKEQLSGIKRNSEKLNALIEDLMALARISRIRNPYEDVPVKELIDMAKERLDEKIKKLNVTFEIPDNLPAIRCDRVKIAEVFFNLIDNAIKFSTKANTPPRVKIGYQDKGETHEFFVQDNGIGIDSAHHAAIFKIFYTIHDSKQYQGTGVGLSVVKSIVDDHFGDVWADSRPGEGATFYFTIAKDLKESRKKTPRKG